MANEQDKQEKPDALKTILAQVKAALATAEELVRKEEHYMTPVWRSLQQSEKIVLARIEQLAQYAKDQEEEKTAKARREAAVVARVKARLTPEQATALPRPELLATVVELKTGGVKGLPGDDASTLELAEAVAAAVAVKQAEQGKPEKEPGAPDVPPGPSKKYLFTLTKAQLLKECAEREVTGVTDKNSKDEIVTALLLKSGYKDAAAEKAPEDQTQQS